jgi:hypothetical protein
MFSLTWFPVSVFCLDVQYQTAGPVSMVFLFFVPWLVVFIKATAARKNAEGVE